ncbi:Vam6/Vps39-like protein [Gryllus bimaculatus]|nr:Vam6/Vps39-like protein [Gryllus bimaculatus]
MLVGCTQAEAPGGGAEDLHGGRDGVLDFLLRQHKHLVIPYLLLAAPAEGEERSPSQDEEAKQLRAKLLTFLERSTHYIPETVIIHFPLDCESCK